MTEEIKKRIEQIRRGEVPEGYKKTKVGIVPKEWDAPKAKTVFQSVSNKNHSGEYEVLSATQDKGVIPRSMIDIDIKYSAESVAGYKFVRKGNYVISLRSFQGGIEYSKYDGLVSPAYTVLEEKKQISHYFYQTYFKSTDYIKRLSVATYGIRDGKQIGYDDFGMIHIPFPPLFEQQKIAEILTSQDKVIELQQKKIEELQKLKQVFLQKMFPKKGETVPEVRFPGFTDAWEQRKLGDVLISLQNNTLSRADLSYEHGAALNVHYGDVLIQFGEYLDIRKESLPMILDISIVAKYKASFLRNGDVIVADTAEDETVGKCSEIAGITDETVISGLHTIPYRPLLDFASGYLGYYMNSGSYHHQLLPLMQGIKVTSISKTAMHNTTVSYPKSEKEQADISAFFRILDNLITLHQRKLEEMKKYKKALMQLLLTGIVRVRGGEKNV